MSDDRLLADALRYVVKRPRVSVQNLQRNVRVGVLKAHQLMNMLEDRGAVGPYWGGTHRDVLITWADLPRLLADMPADTGETTDG